jgi:hypothetical protein
MSRVLDWARGAVCTGITLERCLEGGGTSVCVHGDTVCVVSDLNHRVRCIHTVNSTGVGLCDADQDRLCEALACVARVDRPATWHIHALPFRLDHLDSVIDYLSRDQLRVAQVFARVLGISFPRWPGVHSETYWSVMPCSPMFLRLLAYYRAVHIARVLDRVAPLPRAGQLAMHRLGIRVPSLPSCKQQEMQSS